MSSASSTDRVRPDGDSGFQPWHFYMLLAMAGAIAAVVRSDQTHPAALLLISAAAIAAGLASTALHYALMGFFEKESLPKPVTARTREYLEQEKALILRSIKELEFDRAMRKVGDKDFAEIGGRLRARAVEIMKDLDSPRSSVLSPRSEDAGPRSEATGRCASCDTRNDPDARFCKQCGAKL